MRIRWKLLALLLVVSLLPLLVDAALSKHSLTQSGRKTAQSVADVLVADGQKDLRVAVEHASDMMRIRGNSVGLVLRRYRDAVARSFETEGPVERQRPPLMVEDLDRGTDLPVELVEDPRYSLPEEQGAAVSFDDWGFCLAPDASMDHDALARIQRVLPAVQGLAADRNHLVVRYFVGSASGLHGGFPAQGNFPAGYDSRKRAWYRLAMESDGVVATPPYIDAASRRIVVSQVWRLARNAGAAGVDIDTTEIVRSVDLPSQWGDCVVRIVRLEEANRRLAVVMSADYQPDRELNLTEWDASKDEITSTDPAFAELLAKMRAGASGVQALAWNDEPAWWGFARLWRADHHLLVIVPEERMTVHARTVAESIDERTRAQVTRYGAIVLAAALLVVILAMLGSVKFTRPIKALANSVRRVAAGDLDTRAKIDTGDELEELADNFNRMVGQLKSQMAALEAETTAREQVEAELRIAREMQASLLPACEPPISDHPEFDLAAINLPAKYVAGDFYDFALLDDRTLVLVMADVSGKGVPAALFMTVSLTLMRVAAATDRPPGEVFERVNRVLNLTKFDRSVFVTAVLAYYELDTGRLRYANAGHCTPLVVDREGDVTHLPGPTGTILAPFEGMDWGTNETTLEPGDRLVLYTDGITEARTCGEELLGEEGLASFLTREVRPPADPTSAALTERIGSLAVRRMDDDVTVLVLRRT